MFKNKIVTIIIIIATLILAGIAIFTAVKLYQLRQQSVSPNAPESNPNAAVATAPPIITNNCSLTFTLTLASNPPSVSPSPSPSLSPSPSPSVLPSVTPTPSGSATAQPTAIPTPSSQPTENPTAQPTATTAPSLIAEASPTATPTPTLPKTGASLPTIIATGLGILVILGAVVIII